jgi:hypothetical protein
MVGTARRIWRRGPTSFALLTSLVVLSSFFVVAGAQVASAAQCGMLGGGAGCHLAFRFEDPARSGSYTDTSPHQAGVGQTITNTDLDPLGFLLTIEVEDGQGRRDTSYTGQISTAISSGSGNLSSTAPVTAVNGAASFTLSIDTAGYFQLTGTASGAGIAPVTSGTFRIQQSVCAAGHICTDSFQTLMNATLTNEGTGTIGLSVGIDGVDVRAGGSGLTSCSTPTFTDPNFHAPAETTVDEVRATGNTTKLVMLRIDKAWRLQVLDRGANSYRPCITALVPFTTWQNSPLTFNASTGEYTGLGPDCGRTITYFCRDSVKSSKVGDVLMGIRFPSGSIAGDPRGH